MSTIWSKNTCEYFHHKFLSSLSPEAIKKMCDQAKKFPYQERYIIINEFEDMVLGYTIHVILTGGGENFIIKEINY